MYSIPSSIHNMCVYMFAYLAGHPLKFDLPLLKLHPNNKANGWTHFNFGHRLALRFWRLQVTNGSLGRRGHRGHWCEHFPTQCGTVVTSVRIRGLLQRLQRFPKPTASWRKCTPWNRPDFKTHPEKFLDGWEIDFFSFCRGQKAEFQGPCAVSFREDGWNIYWKRPCKAEGKDRPQTFLPLIFHAVTTQSFSEHNWKSNLNFC